ncbi:MAG: hypothetical protein A2Y82_01685 [Candidatus Buchananbacteria bacterium RBG_13_36_9]|uniref:Uncharacterized protein n=1 Tax=Candidatus Buchananbacteria bacterium RBG_13_36_9 TaxID=1797530 RepID=A0A1G1XMG1_9BACT|nr:MAG: hypothetical protein A2Y82_01685 [Candidatus Buchananbacteria bacterium RBG_13_36_9]
MITGEILKLINSKLKGIIWYLIIIGLLFFILAVAILLYPEVLQLVFIFTFFIISFAAFLIAIKINNIRETFEKILLFIPKKKKRKK